MSHPALRQRALMRLARYRDRHPHEGRITAAEGMDLLAWAATLPDEDILAIRGIGPTSLRWIRDHQLAAAVHTYTAPPPANTDTMLGEMLKSTGWRVEVFWNSGGNWFTARLVAMGDREGKRRYEGGYLVPYEDPIGTSGRTPAEAFQNLSDAVLEWA